MVLIMETISWNIYSNLYWELVHVWPFIVQVGNQTQKYEGNRMENLC